LARWDSGASTARSSVASSPLPPLVIECAEVAVPVPSTNGASVPFGWKNRR